MQNLPTLKPGDSVEIIAPAARSDFTQLKKLLNSWQLNCIVDPNIFGDNLLCANSDEMRFNGLKNALERPDTQAVICVRGGYGSMRLIPALSQIIKPKHSKLFMGMSDITALHLYFNQAWQWPTLHASLTQEIFSEESIQAVKSILFGEKPLVVFRGIPLNSLAEKNTRIESTIVGGNLCLVATSIGTIWQMRADNQIIFLEETNERGYRIDRMLEHLHQAGIFKNAKAVVFGDFINGKEPDGSSLVDSVLKQFAERFPLPVVKIAGVGHDHTNFPLPLRTKTELCLGKEITLTSFR